NVRTASSAALHLLTAYPWPGNVRELRNVVERAMLLAAGDTLQPSDFPIGGGYGARAIDLPALGLNLEETEKSLVRQALERTNWNQTRAGRLLGLNRDQIHYRIEKYQLSNENTPI